jgi:hypothetical protein
MNKEKITELKKELTEQEKIKLLQEGIELVKWLRKTTTEAYIRKQNEINRNNKA